MVNKYFESSEITEYLYENQSVDINSKELFDFNMYWWIWL